MLNHVALTHPGNVRELNEDSVACDPVRGLWLVADGMGGHASGDVASQLVASTMLEAFALESTMDAAIQRAHAAIAQQAIENQQAEGMGSTLVAACIQDNQADIAWVGDSRAYLWRNNRLEQLSKDHSLVQELIDNGELSPEAALYHPQSNVITQVLGVGEPEPDHKLISLQPKDWLVLCSDGLWGEISDAALAKTLKKNRTIQSAAQSLIDQVRDGPGKDNIAIVIVENTNFRPDSEQRKRWWIRGAAVFALFGLGMAGFWWATYV